MFQVNNIQRIDSETVKVTVLVDAKEFAKAKKQGLGQFIGVDLSNHIFREYGVKAYNPTVSGLLSRAKNGIKRLELYYRDDSWQLINNVVRVDFSTRRAA